MTTFQIHRTHALGAERARQLAERWAEAAERDHQMACTLSENEEGQRVTFERPGVRGELMAAADRFDVTVSLNFLLAGFSARIQGELEKNLDAAMAAAAAAGPSDA